MFLGEGPLAQLVEHFHGMEGVRSSNLLRSTTFDGVVTGSNVQTIQKIAKSLGVAKKLLKQLQIFMDKWIKENKIAGGIILVLVVVVAIVYFTKQPTWKKVGTLSERITSEINPIGAFIRVGEKIGENDRTYILNDQPDAYYKGVLNDVYCSTELLNNIGRIKSDRKVENLFIRNLYGTNNVSLETFTNYIKQNNIHCLIIDAYTTYDPNGQASGKLTFLEPDKSYQDNWSFFEK